MTVTRPWDLAYAKILKPLMDNQGDHHRLFRTFVRASACACAMQTREEEYLKEIEGMKRADLDVLVRAFAHLVEDMEKHPHEDVLGPLYSEISSRSTRQGLGEFYTPPEVCRMIAEMTMPEINEWPTDRPLTLLEPAVGGGGLVLAFVEAMQNRGIPPSRVKVTACDLNPIACDMSYVNFALWGIPATVVHGNFLSDEVFAAWRTPFMASGGPGLVTEWGDDDPLVEAKKLVEAVIDESELEFEPEPQEQLVAVAPREGRKKIATRGAKKKRADVEFPPAQDRLF